MWNEPKSDRKSVEWLIEWFGGHKLKLYHDAADWLEELSKRANVFSALHDDAENELREVREQRDRAVASSEQAHMWVIERDREIERLTEELNVANSYIKRAAKELLEGILVMDAAGETIQEKDAEIERLKKENDEWRKTSDWFLGEIKKLAPVEKPKGSPLKIGDRCRIVGGTKSAGRIIKLFAHGSMVIAEMDNGNTYSTDLLEREDG